MKKREHSLRSELQIFWRSIKLLGKISPRGEFCIVTWAIGNACIPFVNIYMSSLIIDELAGGRSIEVLIRYVVITLLLNLVLALLARGVEQMAESEWRLLLSRIRLHVGEKGLNMDYRQIESTRTRVLRNRIEEAEASGFGGLNRFSGSQHYFIEMFVKTIIAAVLVIDVFRLSGQPTGHVIVDMFNSPWISVIMGVLILGLSIGAAKSFKVAAQKLYDLWQVWPKSITLGNYYTNEYLGENGAGKDVRLYKQKKLIMSEFNKHFARPRFLDDKIAVNIKYDGINLGITALATGLVYLFVAMKVLSGAFGIGSLVRFAGLIILFVESFVRVVSGSEEAIMNNNYLRDLYEYLDMPSMIHNGHRPVQTDSIDSLEFRNVTFRYPDTEVDVLHNVSFRLTPGRNTALVGMNGSGKTTIIKLLCRLYDPTEGQILLNGTDIREYEYEEYLQLFSVVFQDFRLFSFPIGQNVASGEAYDAARAREVLEKAGFGERLASMEKGLDTVLYKDFDEEGVEISGGEAQKIALARALYKDAPLMILDEPTAALDPLAEAEVYSKFHEITADKTAVYISHRLSSCRFCDDILVMDQGQLVQQGSHDELVAQTKGRYYALWQAQAQYYQ